MLKFISEWIGLSLTAVTVQAWSLCFPGRTSAWPGHQETGVVWWDTQACYLLLHPYLPFNFSWVQLLDRNTPVWPLLASSYKSIAKAETGFMESKFCPKNCCRSCALLCVNSLVFTFSEDKKNVFPQGGVIAIHPSKILRERYIYPCRFCKEAIWVALVWIRTACNPHLTFLLGNASLSRCTQFSNLSKYFFCLSPPPFSV